MYASDIWKQLVERHGWTEEDLVKLKARGIKKLIHQAWNEGYAKGKDQNKDSLFNNIFR